MKVITLFAGSCVAARGARAAADDAGGRATAHTRAAFQDGLREAGYVESQNVVSVYRYADSQYDRLPALAADLIRNNVTAIFAGGPPAAQDGLFAKWCEASVRLRPID